MKIRMLKTIPGSLDGLNVVDLVEGKEYATAAGTLGDRMGAALVRRGNAVAAGEIETQSVARVAPAKPKRKRAK